MHLNARPVRHVLFLDFDGVTQTPALEHWSEMEHCDGLREVLRAVPGLEVVVTSTHREGRDLGELRALLPHDIGRAVIGATPVTPLGRADAGRQAEIEQWLQAAGTAVVWAAVDDEPRLYRPDCTQLVITSKWVGWDEQTTGAVLRLLA